MSIAIASPSPVAAIPGTIPLEMIYRLSVEQYHQMLRAGILMDGDPVELLEGLLVQKMSKNPPHSSARRRLRKFVERMLPAGWFLDSQEPLTFDTSEPEPDAAVIRGDLDTFAERHPNPEEVALVVEVAESSLAHDQGPKKRIYARSGIVVYWIVNLIERRIEVYTDPTGPAEEPDYRQRQDYSPTDSVPLVIDGREVGRLSVQDLLR
jgi:hypothetical protein